MVIEIVQAFLSDSVFFYSLLIRMFKSKGAPDRCSGAPLISDDHPVLTIDADIPEDSRKRFSDRRFNRRPIVRVNVAVAV